MSRRMQKTRSKRTQEQSWDDVPDWAKVAIGAGIVAVGVGVAWAAGTGGVAVVTGGTTIAVGKAALKLIGRA